MKKLLPATCLIAIALLSGCLSAFYPLFTEKDLVYDPRLVGAWRQPDEGHELYTFEQGTPQSFAGLPDNLRRLCAKGYVLTIGSKPATPASRYFVFMTRIGQHLYLDYFPDMPASATPVAAFYRKNFVPMHSFFRLKPAADGKTIILMQLKESFLEQQIHNKQIRIRHEQRLDGSYVITAPTEELRQYVLKYGNMDAAYEDTRTLNRIN